MSYNSFSRALAFTLSMVFANSAFAQESEPQDCFGIDLTGYEINQRMILTRNPQPFRDQAVQIENLTGCEEVTQDFLQAADLHEINQVLERVNLDVQQWEADGHPTKYPRSENILRLNQLLRGFTTDEEFTVDDGFYIKSAQTLLEVAEFRFKAPVTGAYIEIQRHSALSDYMRDLSQSSVLVSQTRINYLEELSDQGLHSAFALCFNRSLDDPEFVENFLTSFMRDGFNKKVDPIIEGSSDCSPYYMNASNAVRGALSKELTEMAIGMMSSPASFSP